MNQPAITSASRVFKYGDILLQDTAQDLPPTTILSHYSGVYPELINGMVKGPVINDKKELEYEFVLQLGEKG